MHSKKALAVLLSKLKPFEYPDPSLEQYPTDSEIAATILWDAHMHTKLDKSTVADLGCGTGILGIGALVLGAKHVTFLDKDPRVFPVLMENIAKAEGLTDTHHDNYEIVEGDISTFSTTMDIVIQNPPFGTRKKGADKEFLEKAITLAPLVYSLHKRATKQHLLSFLKKHKKRCTILGEFAFPLKQTMPRHEKRIQRIEACCLKVEGT